MGLGWGWGWGWWGGIKMEISRLRNLSGPRGERGDRKTTHYIRNQCTTIFILYAGSISGLEIYFRVHNFGSQIFLPKSAKPDFVADRSWILTQHTKKGKPPR